jgi:acyl-homoserine lactone acylase PvdQ
MSLRKPSLATWEAELPNKATAQLIGLYGIAQRAQEDALAALLQAKQAFDASTVRVGSLENAIRSRIATDDKAATFIETLDAQNMEALAKAAEPVGEVAEKASPTI